MAQDDLGAGYEARSQTAATATSLGDLDSMISSLAPPGQPEQQAQAQQPARSTNGEMFDTARDAALKAATTAAKAAGDVGFGLTAETGPQVVGGVMDAFGNAATGLDHVGDWLNSHVMDLSMDVPSSGNQSVDAIGRALLNPLEAAGNLKGAIGEASTTTGGMIREAATFLTGFIPALRMSKAAGLKGFAAGSVAGATTAATVIDPNAPNVAKMIADSVNVPPSLKPVVDALATNPEDPELLNRARQAINDAGFGFAIEGVVRGVRTVARARKAMSGEPMPKSTDPLAEMRAQYGEATKRDFMILGDPDKPAVSVSGPTNAARARERINRAAENTDGRTEIPTNDGGAIYINFARIDEPDQIKNVMDRMATEFGRGIDVARRGVQSHAETAKLADELGMGVDDLLARREGVPFNAEQALAARRLWGASAQKLSETAAKAASPNAGAVDQYNFRKMMATHYAIQQQVIAARTETARALGAWKIPAKGGVEQARAIQHLLDENGGGAVSVQLAKRIANLAATGAGSGAINAAVRKGWGATSMDAVREAYVTGLLWNPSTHIVNTMSNSFVALQQIAERQAAYGVSNVRTLGEPEIAPGEAGAMAFALVSSLRDAWSMAGKALRTGETGGAIGKSELPRQRAISSTAFGEAAGKNAAQVEAFKETGLGRAIDYIGFAGSIPTRLLGAEDEFFKTIGYRMELQAQAVRMAHAEGLTGRAAQSRIGDIVTNPPENVRIQVADAALYNTFQSESGNIVQAFTKLRTATGLPGTILLPFLKTPGNILNYSFERTPAAPLVGRWRADVAAGGARRDLALARMATGTATMMTALDIADSGLLTGSAPENAGERESLERTGWQAFSGRIGDKFVSYQRTDPVGMLFGFAATMAQRMKQSEMSPEDLDEWQEALAAGVAVASETIVEKSFFTSVANTIEMIQMAGRSPGAVENFVGRTGASMVPFSSAFNTAKRLTDPTARQVMNPYDAIIARFPILSEQLPARRDLWGAPLRPDEIYGRAYDVLSPITVRGAKDSPIDAEMVRLGYGKERIGVQSSFEGVQVNFRDFPNVYDKYVRLAGNELKHPAWGVGAKDFLDQMVSGTGPLSGIYNLFGDEGKELRISSTIDEFRDLARTEIMRNPQTDEEIAFVDYVRQKQDEAIAAKMPR